jgi:hypothetical protein
LEHLGEVHITRLQASRWVTIGCNPFEASWGILDLETCFKWLKLTRATPIKFFLKQLNKIEYIIAPNTTEKFTADTAHCFERGSRLWPAGIIARLHRRVYLQVGTSQPRQAEELPAYGSWCAVDLIVELMILTGSSTAVAVGLSRSDVHGGVE